MSRPSASTHIRRAAFPGLALALAAVAALSSLAVAQKAPPAPAADTAGELPRRVVIRFLTDSDFPPFNFLDEEGVLTGFNIDLARAICLELAATCDIKPAPWAELLIGLDRGDADAVIAGHAILPQALDKVDFTDRYFFMAARFAGRKETALATATPESLEGKKIGVVKASPHEAYLRTFFRDSGIQTFDNADIARDALLESKIDVLFDDGVSLAFWLNGTNSKACCEFKGGPYLEPRFFGDGIAIAVPKKDPQIRKLLNGALKRVRESGRLEELVQRYFPFRIY